MRASRASIIAAALAAALASCGPTAIKTSAPTVAQSSAPESTAPERTAPESTAEPSAVPSAVASGLPQGSDPVTLDPADFVAAVNHPYWPMPVGAKWTYSETEGGDEFKVVVEVLDETKDILGIATTVVHDQVTLDGEIVEDTTDWYAQDADGNLWYMGEDTAEYENGEIV